MLQPYNLDEKNFLNKMHEAKKEIEFIATMNSFMQNIRELNSMEIYHYTSAASKLIFENTSFSK
jgi:hypothetical protein